MKFSHLLLFALAVVCWPAVPDRAQAGLLEAQYNPVPANFANGTTWHTLANWTGIPQYPADPTGDPSPDGYDLYYTQIAHNDDWFFIHYHNSHDFQGDRQLMYFDIDLNRNTGLQGFTGNLAVGAEFYLTGAAFNTGGSTFIGWINWAQSQDGNGDWDIFVAIDRATFMPGVTSFNFVNQNHDGTGDDWYPDGANSGVGGDYFRYGTTPSGVDVTVENTDLKVTVNAVTGAIAVFDKANSLTWNKRNNGAHGPFLNVSSTTDTITFNTTFTANPAVVCTIQVVLSGRKVTFTCDADPAATINGFDFLEPWQATGSMEYFMGEFTDGVVRPVTDNSWPYNLDNTIGVQNFTMPFIGIIDPVTGAGYSVVWETAANAAVKMAKFNGLRTPLTYWRPEKGKFGYQRRLGYNFTASGGYVELAKTYRNDYAAPQGLVVPLSEKAQANPNITKLYGAAEIWDLIHLISDPELAAMGVQKVAHLADWKDIGRAAAIDYANNLGYITLEYDYHTAGPVDEQDQAYVNWSHSYHIKTVDTAKQADGNVIPVGSWGLRCSSDFLEEGQRLIPSRLFEAPCTARYIDQMTQNIWGHDSLDGHTAECFDVNHPRTRSEWVADAIGFYDYLKTLGNSYDGLPLITGAELGKYYQVPNTELFFGIETHWWPWDFGFPDYWGDGGGTTTWDLWESTNLDPTKRIPLWSLVFGDCAIATLYPWDSIDACYKLPENELRIQGVKDAQLILNGAPPLFLSVDHPLGFGSSPWNAGDATKPYRSRWLQSYRNVAHGHTYLADKEMINHTWLTADRKVQRTDWSDGTATIVNFGTSDYTTPDGSILKRNGFWSVGPWGSSIKAYDNTAGREITSLQSNGYFFDDTQVSSTPVPLSIWQKDPNYLRVNVDRYCSNDSFVIKPLLVQETWDFGTTRVYQVDVTTNTISGEIPWTPSGNDGIAVSGRSGWVALDVISCNSSTANPDHSPWLCDSTQSTSCTQWLPGPVEVNCSDVALLNRNWLESACGDCNGADLTGDGEVNAADLMVVTDHWLCSLAPPPALTAYWKFDEDSGNHADDVVGGHQGRLENMNLNTAWASGKYGSALQFDGINDLVRTSYPGILGGASRTVTAWIKTSTNGDIISWGVHVGGRRWLLQLNINANEGVVGALRLSPINGFITGSTDLRDGRWHHIACVLADDGSPNTEDVKLYVDGKAETISDLLPMNIDTGNLDGLNDPLLPVQIGARIPQAAGSPLYFSGQIDDLRIYNQALSAGEIAIQAN